MCSNECDKSLLASIGPGGSYKEQEGWILDSLFDLCYSPVNYPNLECDAFYMKLNTLGSETSQGLRYT